jgi:hypothetical protein
VLQRSSQRACHSLTTTAQCNQAYLAVYTSSCQRAFAATNATCSCGVQSYTNAPATTTAPVSTADAVCENFLQASTCSSALQNCSAAASSVVLTLGHDAYLAAYCGCYSTYLQCLTTSAVCNEA